eukprot:scaffold77475_cov72-Phaeocystis_antarctica.AAC.6
MPGGDGPDGDARALAAQLDDLRVLELDEPLERAVDVVQVEQVERLDRVARRILVGVVHEHLPHLAHGKRGVHRSAQVEMLHRIGKRAQVLDVAVRDEHDVHARRHRAERLEQGDVKGLGPASVEEDRKVVDLEEVARRVCRVRAVERGHGESRGLHRQLVRRRGWRARAAAKIRGVESWKRLRYS